MSNTHLRLSLLSLVTVLLFGTGCRKETNALVTVRVGYMQISECVPLFREEAFAKHGLKLDLKQSPGGAVILNSLMGDGIDIGFSNLVSPILARSQGADILSIAGCTYEDATYSGHSLVVSAGSEVKTSKDLTGRTIALNTLRNIDHLMLLSWLRSEGVSDPDVKLIEVPFPRMTTVLRSKDVAAIAVVEPFLTMAKKEGGTVLGNYYILKGVPRVEVTSYFAKRNWLSKNEKVALAFREALSESVAFYTSHPGEFREAIRALTKLDKSITDAIQLPAFSDTPTEAGLSFLASRLKEEKFLERPVSIPELLWKPGAQSH